MDKISRSSGFTLIEVLAVLAIATLVLAIALPRIGFNASPAATEAITMRMIAALDEDRYAARRRGVTITSELDVQNNVIKLSTRSLPLTLPATVKLGVRAVQPCDPTGRHVVFFADGTSCSPLITLSSSTTTRVISINPLSGAISLAE